MDCDGKAGGAIVLKGAALEFRSRKVLDGVDLDIRSGEIHALVAGQNEGRSSLCEVLAGNLQPDRGELSVDGTVCKLGVDAHDKGIVLVTATPRIFPSMTLGENLIVSEAWTGNGWFLARRRRLAAMSAWLADNGLDLPLFTPLHHLPREDWLFIQLLNRLFHLPRLLILDEAFENLSPVRLRELWPVLRKSLDNGMSLLWATDKPEEVLSRADRISVMRWGRILLTDRAENLDRVNIIRLCYSQLNAEVAGDDQEAARERFYQMMRFTEAMLFDIPSAVIITDPELRVRFANRGAFELFNHSQSEREVYECELVDFMGQDNVRFMEIVGKAVLDGGESEYHSLSLSSADRSFLIDMRVRVIAEGRINVGYMLVIEDVSAREEMRRRLVMSENLASVGLLAAGVAHEVNNPLEIIGNYLNYLRNVVPGGEAGNALEQIDVEAKRIQAIVQNLVAFSGRAGRKIMNTDIAKLSRDICSLMTYQAGNRNIEFVYQGGGSLVVAAGIGEMRQLLTNLLLNSMDALPDGGRVAVSSRVQKGDDGEEVALLTVEDNGTGIQIEKINDVFLPFVSTKIPDGRHQGLGLSIVYGIVENTGGQISVENLPEGGCRFSMSLPLA